MARLDTILNSLGLEQSNGNPEAWNNDGFKSYKTEAIMRRLRPESSSPVIWNYKWSLSIAEPTMDASKIADDLNSDVTEAFRNVPFTELVRAACGYPSHVITSLFGAVSITRGELCSLFQECHVLRSKFELVEQSLRTQHPVAYWIVSTSLYHDEHLPDPSDALTQLFLPIQDLVETTSLTIVPMLKRLAWLAVQYHDKVVVKGCGDWEGLFLLDFHLLDQISDSRPLCVAQSMTANTQAHFGALSYNDFLSRSGTLRDLSIRWSRIADDIKGCSIADGDLVNKISDVTVILLRFRNFYDATALLLGLQNAGFCPEKLSLYWKLIVTDDNYAFYRAQWAKAPGLPFLEPHTYGGNTERKARDLFEFISYFQWRRAENEDDLYGYISHERAEGPSRAPRTLMSWRMIWDTIGIVASFFVASYLSWRNVHRSLSLHSDVEKGLPGDQVPPYSPNRLSTKHISPRDSDPPPERHTGNSSPLPHGRFFTLYQKLSLGKHPPLPKQREGLTRVIREPRLRRKRQYCCKCNRIRKYLSDKLCTCGHERCELCFNRPNEICQSVSSLDCYATPSPIADRKAQNLRGGEGRKQSARELDVYSPACYN